MILNSENDLKMNTTYHSYQDKIIASLENSRNSLRRIARNDDTEYSPQSILNVMEKFVKTVNAMDETILVPCRLMDLKVGDENDPSACASHNHKTKSKHSVQEVFDSTDLFQIYNMLNNVKDGLLWGQTQESTQEAENLSSGVNNLTINSSNAVIKGHVRRPSSVSVTSTNSTTSALSDTESETSGNENDSGIEEAVHEECQTERIAHDFQRHLYGLTNSLRQMTEAAQYLTWRYQQDIGGPV